MAKMSAMTSLEGPSGWIHF